jgi:hypothetical protein
MATKTTTKKQAANKAAVTETLQKASGVNIDTALTGLTQAQTKISRTLADIQEELISKHAELAAIDEAIAIKQAEMEALHGKEAVLFTLDELDAQHAERIRSMQAERDDLIKKYAQLKADAEVARQREEQEYLYQRNLVRKADEDKWTQYRADRDRTEKLRLEDFERGLTVRLLEVEQREIAARQAIEKEQTFEVRVASDVKREVAIITNSMKKDHEHVLSTMQVQHGAQIAGLQKDVEHLNRTVQSRDNEIAELKVALAKAVEAQTTLASKTVDAAQARSAQAEAMATFTAVAGGGNGARRPAG